MDDFAQDLVGDADSSPAADLDALVAQVSADLDPDATESPEGAVSPSDDAPAPDPDDATAADPIAAEADPTAEATPAETPGEPHPLQAELDRERAERARIEAQVAREREEARAAADRAAWQQTYTDGITYWNQIKEQIKAEARDAYDPEAYLDARLDEWDAAKTAWINKFNADLFQHERTVSQSHKARNYANYLRDEHGFSRQEADHIVAYAAKYPQHVNAEVQRLIAARQTTGATIQQKDQRIKELERQLAAQQLASRSPAPGSGRTSGGRKAKDLDSYIAEVLA